MKDNWGNRVMPLTRRNFLVQSLVFGGAVAMPAWAGKVLAADDGVLRARLYNDVNSLDPAIYQNAYNVDVMGLIYPKLIGYKPNSDKWEWQLEAAESIEQIGRAHVCTPVTNAHLVCRLLLDKKKYTKHTLSNTDRHIQPY